MSAICSREKFPYCADTIDSNSVYESAPRWAISTIFSGDFRARRSTGRRAAAIPSRLDSARLRHGPPAEEAALADFAADGWSLAMVCGFHAGRPLIPAHAGPAFHAMPG
jgi:hypothetical protein